MLPQLDRPLIFFDIESTGLNVIRDRILQIAFIKITPDGKREELSMLINPGIPISEEAIGVHGITAADVARKPLFAQVAQQLFDFIGDADLAGYNSNRFDVPMLLEEFDRAGFDFDLDRRRLIDAQRIFYKMEPRNLRAALRYYRGEEMENAHDALADVRATLAVFEGQLEMYADRDFVTDDGDVTPAPLAGTLDEVHDFCNDLRYLDATQRMKLGPDGTPVFAFGKYNNQPVGKTLYKDRNYYNWIQTKDFSAQVKKQTKQLLAKYEAGL